MRILLLYGSDCFASVTHPNGFPDKAPDPAFRTRAEEYLASLPPIPYEGHPGQLEAMLTALETDGPVPISAEDGRRTIELITAIYEAGSLHRGVELPLRKEDPFYTVEGIRAGVPHFYEKSASVADFEGDIVVGGSRKDRSK